MSRTSKTFLVCHGAWGGGWSWRKMHPLMRTAGHRLLTPTYTGLGERAHLAVPSIDLDTHVQDIQNVIYYEDLLDIVLVGPASPTAHATASRNSSISTPSYRTMDNACSISCP
jgi:hypothetical protein